MGACYHKCFLPEKGDLHHNDLLYEKIRKPSFMENYCVETVLKKRCSRILEEDKHHLFENEEWFKDKAIHNNGKPFLDVNKFMESYPHYKIDQADLSTLNFIILSQD